MQNPDKQQIIQELMKGEIRLNSDKVRMLFDGGDFELTEILTTVETKVSQFKNKDIRHTLTYDKEELKEKIILRLKQKYSTRFINSCLEVITPYLNTQLI